MHPKGFVPPSSLNFFGTLGVSSIYLYVSNKKITIIGKLAQKIAYMHTML
jgi:hypothetical protein